MATIGRPTHGVRRRDFLRAVGVGGGALALFGCDDDSGPRADGDAEVLFWLPGGSDIFFTTHKEIASAFSKSNQGVKVRIHRHTGQQAFMEVLLARIAAGNPPQAMVLWETPMSLAVRGSLTALDEFMAASENSQENNWPEALLASCQFKGQTYGLPFQADSYALWYNQDWFEEKGIPADRDSFPKTWDELRSLSKEFTRWKGDKLEAAGFIPGFLVGDPAEELPMWAASNGGQIFDAENQRYMIDSESNVEMLEFFLSWLDEEYQGNIRKVAESGAWGAYPGEQGQPPAFQNQRLAMMLTGAWVMGDLYEVEPKFEHWNIASIPVGPSGSEPTSGYWPNWLAIPAGVDNAEGAFAYLDHLSVDGALALYATATGVPTNANVAGGIAPSRVVEKRGEDFATEATDFFRRQLDIATPMWDSPVQSFATDQLRRALEQVANKAARPRAALAEAQRVCQAELESVL
ncbi:extracellular solute-binding protein [Actinopolymorpha sp. B11F2]|uniref:ABC transporter substrate-binding protein n=1 Tax=Actinopolymorpha sp. B11F2 TaxID=3160862 RepID=UPI0032E500A9